MTSVIENKKIKDKCQIFTPESIAIRMLNLSDYTENIVGKKILENSCGDGEILSIIVQRYINECIANNFTTNKIKRCLGMFIVASSINEYNGTYTITKVKDGFGLDISIPL